MAKIQPGDYVHIVATVNTKAGEGKILYVNPSKTTIQTEAATEPDVELVMQDANGRALYREAVVVRRASCEGEEGRDVGLIQADIPRVAGMNSVSLHIGGKEVSRYAAGTPPVAPDATAGLSLTAMAGEGPNRRLLSLDQAAALAPSNGVSYTVQVRPDTSTVWNTIAVGRPVPSVEIDRNQFPNARTAEVKIIRTNGFDEEVIAQESVDFF